MHSSWMTKTPWLSVLVVKCYHKPSLSTNQNARLLYLFLEIVIIVKYPFCYYTTCHGNIACHLVLSQNTYFHHCYRILTKDNTNPDILFATEFILIQMTATATILLLFIPKASCIVTHYKGRCNWLESLLHDGIVPRNFVCNGLAVRFFLG